MSVKGQQVMVLRVLVSLALLSLGVALVACDLTARSTAISWCAVALFIVLAVWFTANIALASAAFSDVLRATRIAGQPSAEVLLVGLQAGLAFLVYTLLFALAFAASRGIGGAVLQTGGCQAEVAGFTRMLYFAIVTGSTTGYGDLAPVGIAQMIACAEIVLVPVVFMVIVQHLRAPTAQRAGQPSTLPDH